MFTDVLRGLRRNITMTIAMVLTTAISLCLLGAGLIVARMTDQMRQIYGEKVEVTIYLTVEQSKQDPDCHDKICQDLGTALSKDADLAIWDVERPAELVYRIGFNPLWKRVFKGQ